MTAPSWPEQTKLQFEKDTLGLYISGHPFRVYEQELSKMVSCHIAELAERHNRDATIAGMLISQRGIITKTGKRMAILKLEDRTGSIEVTIFSKLLEDVRDLLLDDAILIVKGKVEDDQFTGGLRMVADQVSNLDVYRKTHAKKLILSLANAESERLLTQLPAIVKNYLGGNCPIVIQYQGAGAHAQLVLGDDWKVSLNKQLLLELEQLCGKDMVFVEY